MPMPYSGRVARTLSTLTLAVTVWAFAAGMNIQTTTTKLKLTRIAQQHWRNMRRAFIIRASSSLVRRLDDQKTRSTWGASGLLVVTSGLLCPNGGCLVDALHRQRTAVLFAVGRAVAGAEGVEDIQVDVVTDRAD